MSSRMAFQVGDRLQIIQLVYLWQSNGEEQTNKQTKGVKTMDVVEFLRDFRRMCLSYDNCTGCEFQSAKCIPTKEDCDHEKMIRVVEKWAKEHPVKTRLSEFKKLFPNYNYPSDLPITCVRVFDCTATCIKNCHECKNKFWLTPIEEEKE